MLLLLSNLSFIVMNKSVIYKKQAKNLSMKKVVEITNFTFPFFFLSLSFILKYDKGLQKFHNLSHLRGCLIINYIVHEAFSLSYTLLQNIFQKILAISQHVILVK